MVRQHSWRATLAHLTGLVAAVALALGMVSPAQASALPKEVVRIDDLDLTAPADQRELDARIGRAVENVCAPHLEQRPAAVINHRRCVAEANRTAQAQRERFERSAQWSAALAARNRRPVRQGD